MTISIARRPTVVQDEETDRMSSALAGLQHWIKARDYAGYEPYDILNSPDLKTWTKQYKPVAVGMIQFGRRFGGSWLRHFLHVPASQNPKALALCLKAYCDLANLGQHWQSEIDYLSAILRRLRSPRETEFCWGYDWDFVSFRGGNMSKFSPNCVATYFCASALLAADECGAAEAAQMAESAGRFIVTRLQRSVDTNENLCISYTPNHRTLIYNNSALAAELLGRLGARSGNLEYLSLAKRAMNYLASRQSAEGAWTYGASPMQGWIDSFHTGYNLVALLGYRKATGDHSFDDVIRRGYQYYVDTFFREDGAPKYSNNSVYPIDIHACAQAVITFCAFIGEEERALEGARRVTAWTLANMYSPQGTFYYQKHRLWTDRTPYMRWGQAWMFYALALLWRTTSK